MEHLFFSDCNIYTGIEIVIALMFLMIFRLFHVIKYFYMQLLNQHELKGFFYFVCHIIDFQICIS